MFGFGKRAPTVVVVSADAWDEIAAALPGRLDEAARIDMGDVLLARGQERSEPEPEDALSRHRRMVISGNSRA